MGGATSRVALELPSFTVEGSVYKRITTAAGSAITLAALVASVCAPSGALAAHASTGAKPVSLSVPGPRPGDLSLLSQTITVTASRKISGSLGLTPSSRTGWPVQAVVLARSARSGSAAGGRRATYAVYVAVLAPAPVSQAARVRAAAAAAKTVTLTVSPPGSGAKVSLGRRVLVQDVLGATPGAALTAQLKAAAAAGHGAFTLAGHPFSSVQSFEWGVNVRHEILFGDASIPAAFDDAAAALAGVQSGAAAARATVEQKLEGLLDNLETGPWMLGALLGDGATRAPVVPYTAINQDPDPTRADTVVSILTHGLDTTYQISYGPTAAYGAQTAAVDAGAADTQVEGVISGLASDTTYHYAVTATNSAGTTTTDDATFTTASEAPTIVSANVGGAAPTTAASDVVLKTFGLDTTFVIDYGSTAAYGFQTAVVDAGASDTEVRGTITDLTPGTTYHFKVVATSIAGSTSTTDATFSTGTAP